MRVDSRRDSIREGPAPHVERSFSDTGSLRGWARRRDPSEAGVPLRDHHLLERGRSGLHRRGAGVAGVCRGRADVPRGAGECADCHPGVDRDGAGTRAADPGAAWPPFTARCVRWTTVYLGPRSPEGESEEGRRPASLGRGRGEGRAVATRFAKARAFPTNEAARANRPPKFRAAECMPSWEPPGIVTRPGPRARSCTWGSPTMGH